MRRRISTVRAETTSNWRCHPAIRQPARCFASEIGAAAPGRSTIRAEGDGTDNAACWLKNTIPPRTEAPNSVSGVRGAGVVERRNSAIETSIDRYGGDYHSFALATDPAGESCRAACEGDAKCRAWTYARPGYTGRSARCFLKSTITQPRRRPGLISGVVR